MPVEMRVKEPKKDPKQKHEEEKDALRKQCETCKLNKDIGPRSGCEVKKKLVIDDSSVAWRNKYLFFDDENRCKMYSEKKR